MGGQRPHDGAVGIGSRRQGKKSASNLNTWYWLAIKGGGVKFEPHEIEAITEARLCLMLKALPSELEGEDYGKLLNVLAVHDAEEQAFSELGITRR